MIKRMLKNRKFIHLSRRSINKQDVKTQKQEVKPQREEIPPVENEIKDQKHEEQKQPKPNFDENEVEDEDEGMDYYGQDDFEQIKSDRKPPFAKNEDSSKNDHHPGIDSPIVEEEEIDPAQAYFQKDQIELNQEPQIPTDERGNF
jgi:hypothetical protein